MWGKHAENQFSFFSTENAHFSGSGFHIIPHWFFSTVNETAYCHAVNGGRHSTTAFAHRVNSFAY
jgi:hypothetical protein